MWLFDFRLFLFVGFLFIHSYFVSGQDRSVCWIQNAGFFIDLPDGDILVDAILSSDDAIARAEAPYDNVELIFISHVHGDHFNAEGVLKHLRNNRKARLILTPESFDRLSFSVNDNSFRERIIVSFPEKGKMEPFKSEGFSGQILQFNHSGVQNIGFGLTSRNLNLVYLNGGVQNQELLDSFSGQFSTSDILIANKWPLNNADYIDQVKELFDPELLLMAHHSGSNDPIVSGNGGTDAMEEKMTKEGMRGKVFVKRMECESF